MTKSLLKKSFIFWLPFAAMITFASLLPYALVQQDIRQTANDPQIQIAEDISQAIASGQVTPRDIVSPGQVVDISTSLDTYVMVFDESGNVIDSSAVLGGKTPTLPSGVFESVRQNGEDRFTWQPAPGVRSAVVVDSFPGNASSSGGFVLAGRSIREVEIREEHIGRIAEIAWLAGLIVMFLVVWGVVFFMHKKRI